MDEKERFDLNREHALRAHERALDDINAASRSAIEASNVVLRALLLINGGAVVALLAFVGALETGDGAASNDATLLVTPILWFALAVGFAVTAAGLAYVVTFLDDRLFSDIELIWEHPYVRRPPKKTLVWRNIAHALAVAFAMASLIGFFVGVWTVTGAIQQLGI
jgi:hypothetical protein